MKNLLTFFVLLQISMVSNADYLSEDLRNDVEDLKRDYRQQPTNRENFSTRVATTWEWLNAYSMTGKSLPVNITQMIRPVLPGKVSGQRIKALDYYIEELILLDEDPAALGELVADEGPYEARSFASFTQTYTVGSRAIETGGSFLIARHFRPGYGKFQATDPAGDNYVSITSSRASVKFEPDGIPLAGMHGGFGTRELALIFKVSSGRLMTGDTVTVTYGDRRGGSRGLQISSASTDFLPLPIYVDFVGNDHHYALPIQPIKVSGSTVAGVHGFAPSVVRPGEPFQLSVRSQDAYYNRAKLPVPGYKVFLNDDLIATTAPSDISAITILSDIKISEPGVYKVKLESLDGAIQGAGNPILVSKDAEKIYWGDTHGHSGFAEGIGTPDRFMQWARDDARLDFVTHSEHDIWMDDYEWQVLVDNVTKYSESDKFISYLGYEWTTQNRQGGHHNVLYRNVGDHIRLPNQLYPTLSGLYAGLRKEFPIDEVLVIPHAHQAGDYRQSDPEVERLVEIMSQHGTFEWFGKMYLKQGHQVGFIAGSDNHLSQPGYTSPKPGYMSQRGGLAAVMAGEGGRDAIFDAMKSLNTYATTGDKIIMDVDLNGVGMGKRAPFATKRVIEGRVIGTAPIDTITIVKNGEEIWAKDYLTRQKGTRNQRETYYVTFESDSVPTHPNDNPRGTRGWVGEMDVTGATVESVDATDFFNVITNELAQDPNNPGRIKFSTGTRGDTSSIKLSIAKAKRGASIKIKLKPAEEQGSPSRFRARGTTPASEVVLKFSELKDGMTEQVIPFQGYNDKIILRRVIEDGPEVVEFNYTDNGMLQGDYYYVRVRQANDAMAWSSPIWVGGIRPR